MLPTRALDVVHAEPIEDRRAMRTGRQPRLLRALHGAEARRFIRRLAALIAAKAKEEYSQVMCNTRKCLSMVIMRSMLVVVKIITIL